VCEKNIFQASKTVAEFGGEFVIMKKGTVLVVLILILMLVSLTPVPVSAGGQANELGLILPNYAKRYYDSDGYLIGAVVQDPNEVDSCPNVDSYDAEEYLPAARIRKIPEGLEVQQIADGHVESSIVISDVDLIKHFGSVEAMNVWIDQSVEQAERVSEGVSRHPGVEPAPEWWYPQTWWEKEYTEVVTHQWTNIAELYSGKLMRNHLRLKMNTGTQTVTKVGGGGFSYGSAVTYSKTWVTDLYAQPWQTFTVKVMMDYTYEYWVQYINTGWGIYEIGSKRIWWCSMLRGGTVELTYPYPDIDRDKPSSDDSVSLNPGQTKTVIYQSLSGTQFSFDIALKLKKKWFPDQIIELEVPIISFTYLDGHFSSYEAVYELTSTANYYHVWDIYEFGMNYGTTSGFVPAFTLIA
jgi:hypothetical protein